MGKYCLEEKISIGSSQQIKKKKINNNPFYFIIFYIQIIFWKLNVKQKKKFGTRIMIVIYYNIFICKYMFSIYTLNLILCFIRFDIQYYRFYAI